MSGARTGAGARTGILGAGQARQGRRRERGQRDGPAPGIDAGRRGFHCMPPEAEGG